MSMPLSAEERLSPVGSDGQTGAQLLGLSPVGSDRQTGAQLLVLLSVRAAHRWHAPSSPVSAKQRDGQARRTAALRHPLTYALPLTVPQWFVCRSTRVTCVTPAWATVPEARTKSTETVNIELNALCLLPATRESHQVTRA